MMTPINKVNGFRTKPAYTISQAAKLAGVHPITVKRWLYGDKSPYVRMRPVFGDKERVKEAKVEVSFLELMEIVVVGRFRRRTVKLDRLRRAHKYARNEFRVDYPFAYFKLKTDGAHVLRAFEEREPEPGASLLSLDRDGQWTLPGDVIKTLEDFDFEEEFAMRWFPVGRTVPIVVDPRYGSGRPTVTDRRVTVDEIYRHWKVGQTIAFIASDFRLERSLVEATLRYAESYVK